MLTTFGATLDDSPARQRRSRREMNDQGLRDLLVRSIDSSRVPPRIGSACVGLREAALNEITALFLAAG